jgi:hypothetical protein
MKIEDIYNIIDEEPLDLPFKKALLALVIEVEKLQPKDAGAVIILYPPHQRKRAMPMSDFEEAYNKFRYAHVNASFMPKDMALAMWKAGQRSVIESLPSEEESEKARWMHIKKVIEGSPYEISWTACYNWLRSRLQEKITNREDGL